MAKPLIFICVTNTGTICSQLVPTLIQYAKNTKYDVNTVNKILELRFQDKLMFKEIEKILNIPKSTVGGIIRKFLIKKLNY